MSTIEAMTAPQTPKETGAELGGRYRLVAPIGVGVSSRVFLAVDTQLRRRVAVKVLHEALSEDQAFLTRFRAEARAAAALSHPNIVAVYDWGEDRRGEAVVPYLVTEYLAGGSLRSMLDAGHRLSPSQALVVGLDAARALAHAHDRGFVHRDVKPANLLFDGDGRLRLADFGLARALAEASWTEPAGTTIGTARYASPEQVLGRRLDGRSDVYSLALAVIESVTGRVPLMADTAAGTMARRSQEDVEVPMDFGRLRPPLLRATTLHLDHRSDAGEFEIGLMAAAEAMPRPEPLPLVPTLGDREQTDQLHLSDGLAGLSILGPLDGESGAGASLVTSAADSGRIDLPGDGAPLVGGVKVDDPTWAVPAAGREPVVVADDDERIPPPSGLHGRVDPLDAAPTPQALGDEPVEPRRGRGTKVLLGLLVAVLLAGGVAGWWFGVRTPSHDVPAWVGDKLASATAEARRNGWKVDTPTKVRRDGTAAGEVVAQSPKAGTSLAEGAKVALTVSLGPTLTPWPKLVGLPEADAIAAITAAGLTAGTRTTGFDESVAKGAVVTATPAAGRDPVDANGQVPKQTPVDVKVSDGPAPRAVPDGLVGATKADATAKLAAVQLTAQVAEDFSDTVAAGTVISAGIPAGTQVARDSAVPLVVSKGPQPVPIPNVIGQSGTAAATALQAAGFVVSGVEGSPTGMVLQTDPPAGEPHQKGTAVRIFTRQ